MKNLNKGLSILILGVNVSIYAQTNTHTTNAVRQQTLLPGETFDTLAAKTDRTSVNPVPEHIHSKFITEFPATESAAWKIKGKNYIVSYTDPKTRLGHIIVYNEEGNIIQKEHEVSNKVYPKPIYQYYLKEFPGENYFKVWQTKGKDGQTYYYIQRNKKTLWFDKEGNYLNSDKVKSSNLSSYSAT